MAPEEFKRKLTAILSADVKGYAILGRWEEAEGEVREALRAAEEYSDNSVISYAHRILGEIYLETNPKQAAPHFEESIAVSREIKAENDLALAHAGYGRFHKKQGNVVMAREYLTKALEIFERLGTMREPEKVREALAQLPVV